MLFWPPFASDDLICNPGSLGWAIAASSGHFCWTEHEDQISVGLFPSH